MARPSIKKLVRAADYNGYKDILFMMDPDDFRLSDERFSSNYAVLGEGAYAVRAKTFTVDGKLYQVHADWSLTLTEAPISADGTVTLVMAPTEVFVDGSSRIELTKPG